MNKLKDDSERYIGETVEADDDEITYSYTVGVSEPHVRNFVTDYIVKELGPCVVLDLGCGSGAYGQVLHNKGLPIEVIGVDGCMKYLTSVHCLSAYTARIHMDIVDFLLSPIDANQDVTLCMDVIEHFEKEKAIDLLDMLPTPAIISTPLFWYEQGIVDGNPLEEHKCYFSEEEILEYGFDKLYDYEYDERGYIGAFIKQ